MSEKTKQKSVRAETTVPVEFIDHWCTLIESFQFSPQEFYARVEKALADRKIPEIELDRVDWKEGGPFSARREYLRITRERLMFDVCAAPFGTGFFVSHWFGEKPKKFGFILFCLFVLTSAIVLDWIFKFPFGLYRYALRTSDGNMFVTLVAMIIALFLTLFGFYVVWYLRSPPETYYRYDVICMYQTAVHNAVVQVIDEIAEPKGISPLSEFDRRPVFRKLLPHQRQGSGNGRR